MDTSQHLLNIRNILDVDWYKVAEGCVLSAGEVYGVDTFAGSILILVGLAIYSPVLSVISLTGAAIGTVTSLYYTALPRFGVCWAFV